MYKLKHALVLMQADSMCENEVLTDLEIIAALRRRLGEC